jgi:hypothetical protein
MCRHPFVQSTAWHSWSWHKSCIEAPVECCCWQWTGITPGFLSELATLQRATALGRVDLWIVNGRVTLSTCGFTRPWLTSGQSHLETLTLEDLRTGRREEVPRYRRIRADWSRTTHRLARRPCGARRAWVCPYRRRHTAAGLAGVTCPAALLPTPPAGDPGGGPRRSEDLLPDRSILCTRRSSRSRHHPKC